MLAELADILLSLHHVIPKYADRLTVSQCFYWIFPAGSSVLRRVSAGQQLEGLSEEVSERPAGPGVGDLLLGGSHALPEELLHPSSARRAECQQT